MKKAYFYLTAIALVLAFCASKLDAQIAYVTANVQDTTGQNLVGGTWRAEYVKPYLMGSAYGPVEMETGNPFTDTVKTGTLDTAGFMGVYLRRTDYILPRGGSWRFTICSLATSPCVQYATAITDPGPMLTSQFRDVIGTIAVSTSPDIYKFIPKAYNSNEIVNPQVGSRYYDLTQNMDFIYDGSKWNATGQVALTSGIHYADQAKGTTATDKISAAVNDCGTSPCLVVIPPTLGAGNPSYKDNIRVLDLRGASGPNSAGAEGQAYAKDFLFRSRWTSAPYGVADYQVLHVHADASAGGVNADNGPKTNYTGIYVSMPKRTPGQGSIYGGWQYNFSKGDTIGLAVGAIGYGGTTDGGDEGIEAITGEARQGGEVMTGTVAAINGSIITYSAGVNDNGLGEQRPVIITTPAKVYSTGTVVVTNSSSPTVTGTGTAWNTLCPGAVAPCTVSNLFFNLPSEDYAGAQTLRHVVPIGIINSATSLSLNMETGGLQTNYAQAPSGSLAYNIFKGSIATAVAPFEGQTITLASTSDFSIGDTIEQVLGYAMGIRGMSVRCTQYIQVTGSALGPCGAIQNIGPRTFFAGLGILGNFTKGLAFDGGRLSQYGIHFNQTLDNVIPAIYVSPISGHTSDLLIFIEANPGGGSDTFLGLQQSSNANNRYWQVGSGFMIHPTTGNLGLGGVSPNPHYKIYNYSNDPSDTLFYGNEANAGATGKLIQLQFQGVDKFTVDTAGNVAGVNKISMPDGDITTAFPAVVAVTNATAKTDTIANTTVFTTTAAGLYRISGTIKTTTAGSAGTLALAIGHTGFSFSKSLAGTISLTSATATADMSMIAYIANGQTIQYNTTVTGNVGAQYRADIIVERLQ